MQATLTTSEQQAGEYLLATASPDFLAVGAPLPSGAVVFTGSAATDSTITTSSTISISICR